MVVNPSGTTTFSVTGTYTNTGCASTQTISVAVFEPQFSVSGNTAICMGSTTTLTASGAGSYLWNGSFPFASFKASPKVYTVYQVTATSFSNNVYCSATQSIGVKVNPNPTVTAATSRTLICEGESVNLTASGALTYTWNTFPPGASITVTPAALQIYTVTGTNVNGCFNTVLITVTVALCEGLHESEGGNAQLLIYPNPSQGEFNIVSQTDINLSLVKALGQLIRHIHLDDMNNRQAQVSIAAPGVYFIIGRRNEKVFAKKIVVGG